MSFGLLIGIGLGLAGDRFLPWHVERQGATLQQLPPLLFSRAHALRLAAGRRGSRAANRESQPGADL